VSNILLVKQGELLELLLFFHKGNWIKTIAKLDPLCRNLYWVDFTGNKQLGFGLETNVDLQVRFVHGKFELKLFTKL